MDSLTYLISLIPLISCIRLFRKAGVFSLLSFCNPTADPPSMTFDFLQERENKVKIKENRRKKAGKAGRTEIKMHFLESMRKCLSPRKRSIYGDKGKQIPDIYFKKIPEKNFFLFCRSFFTKKEVVLFGLNPYCK
ncbi:MAG: hypothetical protein LUC18_01420, partial [Porphyromonadaceae bacterium]|nr:hypothetical protein [Porphyromonadaceae bacterium]